MSDATDQTPVLDRLIGQFAQSSDAPAWLVDLRSRAAERYRELGLPNSKQEAWRYTSLRKMLELDLAPAESISALTTEDVSSLNLPEFNAWRMVFVNGFFNANLSDLKALPEGVEIAGLSTSLGSENSALRDRLKALSDSGKNAFVALNTAQLADGASILIHNGVELAKPLEILHIGIGMDEPRIVQPRHLVMLGEGAKATLVERYVALDAKSQAEYFTNAVIELDLAKGAELHHHRVQNEGRNAFHLSSLFVRQQADSRYRGVQIAIGATWARTDFEAVFEGEGASSELDGLLVAGDDQLSDCHLDIQHQVAHCASESNIRGILDGKSRGVFDGRIFVAKDAQQTDAHLNNANLLLSRDAEIDTKPQLEILADDVKCSHGTTVGQIEPEMLFYLRSRGIPADQARLMLCQGFAEQTFEALGDSPLHQYLSDLLADQLLASAEHLSE